MVRTQTDQVMAMGTTQQTRTGGQGGPDAHIDVRPTACTCGQDLDLVTSGHCPRCGTQLGAPYFEAVGFWYAA
jgi:hypothetical protein